jgi:hypothetical protein
MKKLIIFAMVVIIAFASCEKKEIEQPVKPVTIENVTLKYKVVSSENNMDYKYQNENGVVSDWISVQDSVLVISFSCPPNSNYYIEAGVNPYQNYNTNITASIYVNDSLVKSIRDENLNGCSQVILSGRL